MGCSLVRMPAVCWRPRLGGVTPAHDVEAGRSLLKPKRPLARVNVIEARRDGIDVPVCDVELY